MLYFFRYHRERVMTYSLGVLAGMGPRSTAPFIDMLVDECQKQYGARFDIDYPKMHIISLPTPLSLITFLALKSTQKLI